MEDVQPILVPWLQVLVEKLEFDTNFGSFCPIVSNVNTSAPKSLLWTKTAELGDGFTVTLPYADDSISWVVLLCWEDASIQPEFEYPDDPDFEPDFDKLPEWDPTKPHILVDWLLEMVMQFNQFQKNLVIEYDTLAIQLNDCSEFDDQALEVRLYRTGPRCGTAVFVIDVLISEVKQLPSNPKPDVEPIDDMQFTDDTVIVVGKFKEFGDAKPQVDVRLNPFINQLLSESNAKLPDFTGSFGEFAVEVSEVIRSEVNKVVRTLNLRCKVICMFMAYYDDKVIEFDSNTWLTVTILLGDVNVRVELPEKFGFNCARVIYRSNLYEKRLIDGKLIPYSHSLSIKNIGGKHEQIFNDINPVLEERIVRFREEAKKNGI